MNRSISGVNRSDQQTWVKSWDVPKGRVDLFLTQDGTIRADLLQNGRATDLVLNVIGVDRTWMTSPQDLTRALKNTYATLSHSDKQECYLRVGRPIFGGGTGHSREASDNYDSGSHDNSRDNYTEYGPTDRDDPKADAPSREDHEVDAPAQNDPAENRTDSHTVDDRDPRGAADHHDNNHDYSHAADTAIEAGLHVAAHEILGAAGGFAAGFSYTADVNRGENEWVMEHTYNTNPEFREAIDRQVKEANNS